MDTSTSLEYHEPTVTTILIQSLFLLLLNIVDYILDSAVYCGLIGQIFLGVVWGTPLAGWLTKDVQATLVDLGYLGLILLVYEGGLQTSARPFFSNLPLSTAIAITGIGAPVGLSFVLTRLADASEVQAFTAGAALSSTSLGTVFTILSTAGVSKTRLGVVLSSAALLDDVVGLVMIEVVSSLGTGAVSAETIARPIGASLALLTVVGALAWLISRFLIPNTATLPWSSNLSVRFFVHIGLLVSIIAAAGYAGASVLFAAFLTGAVSNYWDDEHGVQHNLRAASAFEHYLGQPLKRLLKPIFFASIGFSIPIKDMFGSEIVWKGIVYAVLMTFAKLVTGLWLIRSEAPFQIVFAIAKWIRSKRLIHQTETLSPQAQTSLADDSSDDPNTGSASSGNNEVSVSSMGPATEAEVRPTTHTTSSADPPSPPKSLYPISILGLSMVARGEIGFLIASVGRSSGILTTDIYLIVIWAITLCTFIGPIGVGLLVKRVKRLEVEKGVNGSPFNVLGEWGV